MPLMMPFVSADVYKPDTATKFNLMLSDWKNWKRDFTIKEFSMPEKVEQLGESPEKYVAMYNNKEDNMMLRFEVTYKFDTQEWLNSNEDDSTNPRDIKIEKPLLYVLIVLAEKKEWGVEMHSRVYDMKRLKVIDETQWMRLTDLINDKIKPEIVEKCKTQK
jgi:hypothetical protein